MNDPDEQYLREALDGAVRDLEPTDRLTAIRARTARPARRSWYAVGGERGAAAAVVVAVTMVTTGDGDTGPDVAATTSPTSTPTTPDTTEGVEPPASTTPVYYVGQGSDGPAGRELALYRYFEPEADPLQLLMSTPSDPDYQTLWEEGSLLYYAIQDDVIVVEVTEPAADELAMQQLVYTLQGVTGTRLPVQTVGPTINSVPVQRAPALDVLSHVNISDPGEGYTYSDSFTARGVGNGYEGTVACRLVGEDGAEVWSAATIAGAQQSLEPWELDVDLTGVAPGGYVLICQDDDPAGGAEGLGTFTDNRTIYVTEQTVAPVPEPGDPAAGAARVFYVGPGPTGPDAPAAALYAVDAAGYGTPLTFLTSSPDDPDYSTRWPAGSLVSYEVGDDAIVVRVSDDAPVEDDLAFQQLSHTLHASTGSDLPVRLVHAGGSDVAIAPRTELPELEVLSHMNVLVPAEGATYDAGGSFVASGRANGFEGTVFCDLRDRDDVDVWENAVVNGGLLDGTLNPWQMDVDLAGLAPGPYTLRCVTDDPTAGTEGRGQDVDTRRIIVE